MATGSVLVVAGRGARRGAGEVAAALRQSGRDVELRTPVSALTRGLSARHRFACVFSCGPDVRAHAAGAALRRAGLPWIALQLHPPSQQRGRTEPVEARLVRMADVAASPDAAAIEDLHARVRANAVATDATGEDLTRLVLLAAAWRTPPSDLRVLIIGPTNSPHVEDFALGLRDHGAEVFVAGLPWGGGLGPSALPAAGVPVLSATWPTTLWIRRLRRELRPDVVHAHWLPNAVAARLGGARPLVATAWGSDVYLATRRRTASYRLLVRRAELVLADSAELLHELRRLGAPADRSRTFSWGVDTSVFAPTPRPRDELRRSLGVPPGPMILSVRGFNEIYNPGVVIAAFERLAETRPELQLVLKHNSTERPTLPELRFPDRVHVVGPQPRERLADWLRAASVCVSLASTDSSPRSVWEAMACGCPCVVSDLAWARQELEPGRHALLAPIEAVAVAGAVGRLLDDEALAQSVADAALRHVGENHDREREMRRMIELHRTLAAHYED